MANDSEWRELKGLGYKNMIRFCDKEIGCVEYDSLTRYELLDYFLSDHKDDILCVYDSFETMRYMGIITYDSYKSSINVDGTIIQEYLILETDMWQQAREYFEYYNERGMKGNFLLPVFSQEHQLICFAYEDEKADREIRMLRELQEIPEAFQFADLYTEYQCVRIYGFNELAYFLVQYLKKQGVPVEVVGAMWQGIFNGDECKALDSAYLEIYAEGIDGKKYNWRENGLRSVSVEFECIDKIYEFNIKKGVIKDAGGDFAWLVAQLKKEQEIVILGTGVLSVNAYDLLLANGIDISCFVSEDKDEQKRSLFGKKVLPAREVKKRHKRPIFLECCSENSAWGFGGVDEYDYRGFQRNQKFFLIKDYVNIPVGNLSHILKDKNIVLIGNLNLCYNVSHILGMIEGCRITYCDLLDENSEKGIRITSINKHDIAKHDICFLIEAQYYCNAECAGQISRKRRLYFEKLEQMKINDVSVYFSNSEVLMSIQQKNAVKYKIPCLTPGKIALNISGHMSGNEFFGNLLDGHPDVMLMNFGIGIQEIISNIFLFCIQLAEERAENILPTFWRIWSTITTEEEDLFLSNKETVDEKFWELMSGREFLTPQELFVAFHVVYEKILGRDITDVQNMLIYYEPRSEVGYKRINYEEWLCDEKVQGISIMITRNSYTRVGSYFKHLEHFHKFSYPEIKSIWEHMLYTDEDKKEQNYWKRFKVKFETLKTKPRETLEYICDQFELSWSNILLKTTMRGEVTKYRTGKDVITGFDLKPVYNLYEEYFSEFDRFRIDMLFGGLQKRYGYSYMSCLNFSKRQLQEMYLKPFGFEDKLTYKNDYWKKQYRKDFIDKFDEYFQKERKEAICSTNKG